MDVCCHHPMYRTLLNFEKQFSTKGYQLAIKNSFLLTHNKVVIKGNPDCEKEGTKTDVSFCKHAVLYPKHVIVSTLTISRLGFIVILSARG
jgi:hypothetical protein